MTLDTSEEQGKLFVGGLSWETTKENLCEYFCRFGDVIDCVVMKHAETGRSRGFGFVTFKDPSCVQVVLSSGPHQLDGRTIDPKSCNAKNAQKGKRDGKMSGFPKIFLGGLPPNVNETVLRDFFSQYGKVLEVIIMYDQEKKKTRGFGFLSFENEEAVNKVVAEHYVNISGKKVEVKRAEPRDRSSQSKGDGVSLQNSGIQAQQVQQQPQHQQQPNQLGAAQWWPPQAPPPGAGPNGASIPLANGVVVPNSYPGWGPPAAQAGYGPGAGWTAAPPTYQGFQGWSPAYPYPPQGWGAQQGYAYGAAYPVTYPNYGTAPGPVSAPAALVPPPANTVPAPAPAPPAGGPVIASPPFAQPAGPMPPPPPPPMPPATITTPLTQAAGTAAVAASTVTSNPTAQSSLQPGYAQDTTSYGPMRVYSYQGYQSQGDAGSGVTNASNYSGNVQTSSNYARLPTPMQGYHPYRRT